eukprot:TRINITY_DN3349_c0_g1_i15.p1 TRINITY_DN3349_c0_g1~~TRINITY_DN3349_c0_g1_i15.p1  ORF type:complete len:130 (-),score=18.33 TRINITY_DN3349_c0_g1_i15:607-996(-)
MQIFFFLSNDPGASYEDVLITLCIEETLVNPPPVLMDTTSLGLVFDPWPAGHNIPENVPTTHVEVIKADLSQNKKRHQIKPERVSFSTLCMDEKLWLAFLCNQISLPFAFLGSSFKAQKMFGIRIQIKF